MTLDTTDLDLALKGAQANLASAQANFDAAKAKSGTNVDQLLAAKAAVDKAASVVQQAQAAYDRIGGASNPSIGMTSQAVTLQQATSDYNAAVANYKVTASGINDTALRTAQAQVDSAQVAVDQAKNNIEKAKITAPFDGVVSVVNYHAGDTAGSSGGASGAATGSNSAVTVVNLSNLEVQVNVAEVDLPKIKVGNAAQLTLDALPGNTYPAKVVKVDPVGTVTQGVVNYPVIVGITNPDGSIEPGMTANLNIVVAQRDNVLMIPTRAIHSQGTQKTVTVLYKGQTLSVPITTGLASDQNVEVTSGLQQGDLIVLNQSQTQSQGNAGRGFGGGGFIFGR